MKHLILIKLSALLIAGSIAEAIQAQAYCALRDPVRQIGELYPGHSYVSHVGVVTTAARKEVSNRLPFTLHFNELGSHTLYAVGKGETKVGYVHVRPEITRWGIMEITWSLDADLRVQDFAFQRCRNRRRAILENEDFKKQIRGKSFDELLSLINQDGTSLTDDGIAVNSLDEEFAASVIRCALKTIVLTDIVWEKQVKAARILPQDSKLQAVTKVYTPSLQTALERMFIGDNYDIDRENVKAFRIVDGSKKKRFLIETRWLAADPAPIVRWYVSEGTITKIATSTGWPSDEVAKAFQLMNGKSLTELTNCKSTVELSALEVLLICRELGQSQ